MTSMSDGNRNITPLFLILVAVDVFNIAVHLYSWIQQQITNKQTNNKHWFNFHVYLKGKQFWASVLPPQATVVINQGKATLGPQDSHHTDSGYPRLPWESVPLFHGPYSRQELHSRSGEVDLTSKWRHMKLTWHWRVDTWSWLHIHLTRHEVDLMKLTWHRNDETRSWLDIDVTRHEVDLTSKWWDMTLPSNSRDELLTFTHHDHDGNECWRKISNSSCLFVNLDVRCTVWWHSINW